MVRSKISLSVGIWNSGKGGFRRTLCSKGGKAVSLPRKGSLSQKQKQIKKQPWF